MPALTTRTPERVEFLSNVLVTALEHYGYGFPELIEYHIPDGEEASWYAVIADRYAEDPTDDNHGKTWRVDLDTIARGLGIIRRAIVATTDEGTYLHHSETFERLYVSTEQRAAVMAADRENEAVDLDVIDALAILECALFGRVVNA